MGLSGDMAEGGFRANPGVSGGGVKVWLSRSGGGGRRVG